MNTENRREFMKKTGAISALSAGALINLNPNAIGANERVILGIIGARSRGRQVGEEMIASQGCFKTICDIDQNVCREIGGIFEKKQGSAPGHCNEFEKVLDDKDIDAVLIATPDHWHARIAIMACQAGKDVYVEKPLSQTIHEGQMMRDAARKYDRVVQVGLQRRSAEHFATAVDYAASGKLGSVCTVKAWMCQIRGSIGNPPDSDPPEGVDYDRWLGPAPKRPFNKNRFHYNWRFFWDYCNTELGNQGVHMMDIALWGIHKLLNDDSRRLPSRVSSQAGIYWPLGDAKEVPDTQIVTYEFGDLMLVWELRSFQDHNPIEGTEAGTGFYGTDGTLIVDGRGWKVYDKEGKVEKEVRSGGGSHSENFFECIKSRKRPNADIELGRLSTTLCHLGNISHHLGRSINFDPVKENFGDDQKANGYLTKEYREPYGLPEEFS